MSMRQTPQVQLLRKVEGVGQEVHFRPLGIHLQRMYIALQRNPRRRGGAREPGRVDRDAQAGRDQGGARRVRDRAGAGETGALGRRLQPLQARAPGRQARRGGDRQGERAPGRADGGREDAAGADAGADPPGPLHHRRRHDPHRGRIRGRGRREHPGAPAAGKRLQHRRLRARNRLYRRTRQDRPQIGEPLDHARRVRRGGPAGAPQDPGGDGGERAAAGRPQAPPAGVHPDRHHEHPLHLRRGLRGSRQDCGNTVSAAVRSASSTWPGRTRRSRNRISPPPTPGRTIR